MLYVIIYTNITFQCFKVVQNKCFVHYEAPLGFIFLICVSFTFICH